MRRLASLLALALVVAACDRNIEPFDPDEQPREPDLSRIFPEGADQAAPQPPSLPPAPGEGRGAAPLPEEVAAAGGGAPISGTVELAPELRGRTPAPAVLYVIARREAGGPPLAVKRIDDPRFPLAFTLGPEDRMIQSLPFEGPIALSARLDADGDAGTRAPGDATGEARGGPVSPGATGVWIVLDTLL